MSLDHAYAPPRMTVSASFNFPHPPAVRPFVNPFDVLDIDRPTVKRIQAEVAAFYGLKPIDMLYDCRARRVARPRQLAMWLACRLTVRSLGDIGRRFGGKHHTTVLHARRKIDALRETDPVLRDAIDRLVWNLTEPKR